MLINKLTNERYNSLPPNMLTYCCWKNISFKNPFFENNCLKSVALECNINNNNFNPPSLDLMKPEQSTPIFDSITDVTTLAPACTSVAVSSFGSNTTSPALSSISYSSSMLSSSSLLTPNYLFYYNMQNQNNTTVGETDNCHDTCKDNKNQENKNNVVNYITYQTGGVDYSIFDNDNSDNNNMNEDENEDENENENENENRNENDIGSENDSNSHTECVSTTGDSLLLPNKNWSSDHLPVYAVFQLK